MTTLNPATRRVLIKTIAARLESESDRKVICEAADDLFTSSTLIQDVNKALDELPPDKPKRGSLQAVVLDQFKAAGPRVMSVDEIVPALGALATGNDHQDRLRVINVLNKLKKRGITKRVDEGWIWTGKAVPKRKAKVEKHVEALDNIEQHTGLFGRFLRRFR